MVSSLVDRLDAIRREYFVGRSQERSIFQSALEADELPFFVLYIFGPSGIGKTALLQEFTHIVREAQIAYTHIDGRTIEPSPHFFTHSLQEMTETSCSCPQPQQPSSGTERRVYLIDTYERLAPLDDWLRDTFLPQLPHNTLVVIASRNPPTLAWRTDPAWQAYLYLMPLRNLSPDESQAYLDKCQVSTDQYRFLLEFTHGYPLALSLVADVLRQRGTLSFEPTQASDVINTLATSFVQEVPDAVHRSALEACAVVRTLTESLLCDLLELNEARTLFDWLCGLSFIHAEQIGISPHELARHALATNLRWRNPEQFAKIRDRALTNYKSRFLQTHGQNQRRILFDALYLYRDSPLIGPYFKFQIDSNYTDNMTPSDEPVLLNMVERHEGQTSAQLAAFWFKKPWCRTIVVRNMEGQPLAFVSMIALEQAPQTDLSQDPATQAAWHYLQTHAPIRPGETAIMFRFWMVQDSYQSVSQVQSHLFIAMVQHYLITPGLAHTFLPCADPDFWKDVFSNVEVTRIEQLDFEIEGVPYAIFGHDWRSIPPTMWIDALEKKEFIPNIGQASPTTTTPLFVLSQPEFTTAVRNALQNVTNSNNLRSNPLLQTRLVIERAGTKSTLTQQVSALQQLLQDAHSSLQQSSREQKFFRAVHHTYFQPASTQETAAELLDLPFSTYRRHLRAGVELIMERLWQQEIGEFR